MKNMNRINLIIGIIIVFISCSEDALDLKPLDAISEVDVFNDVKLLEAYVNATYARIPDNFSSQQRMGTDPLADHVYLKNNRGEGAPEYAQNRVDALNVEGITKNAWSRNYAGIRHINSYFAQVEGSSIAENELDPLTGQMHFLRAYFHFDLMSYYGGIPIITDRFEISDENFDLPKNTIEEVVDFIVSELDKAIPLLEETAPSARASKAAAMALKGRVLLYAASPLLNSSGDMSKWTTAADANKAVMDLTTYPITDDYRSIFLSRPAIADEVIFTREYNLEVSQGTWSGANTMFWPNGYQGWHSVSPNQKFVDLFEMTNGETPYLSDGVTVNPASGYDPQNPYENRDPRFSDIVLYNGAMFKDRDVQYWIEYETDGNGDHRDRTEVAGGLDTHLSPIYFWEPSATNYAFRKFTDPTELPALSGNPTEEFTPDIKFRKTEFYLNYAETQIALGNEGAARDAINAVRARTSVGMPAITVSGEELVEAYRRERAIELSLEGHRFFDIRRWRIAENVMGKPMYGINVEKLSTGDIVYSYGTKVATATELREWDDRLYWLPIPDREIKASNNALKQNFGY